MLHIAKRHTYYSWTIEGLQGRGTQSAPYNGACASTNKDSSYCTPSSSVKAPSATEEEVSMAFTNRGSPKSRSMWSLRPGLRLVVSAGGDDHGLALPCGAVLLHLELLKVAATHTATLHINEADSFQQILQELEVVPSLVLVRQHASEPIH